MENDPPPTPSTRPFVPWHLLDKALEDMQKYRPQGSKENLRPVHILLDIVWRFPLKVEDQASVYKAPIKLSKETLLEEVEAVCQNAPGSTQRQRNNAARWKLRLIRSNLVVRWDSVPGSRRAAVVAYLDAWLRGSPQERQALSWFGLPDAKHCQDLAFPEGHHWKQLKPNTESRPDYATSSSRTTERPPQQQQRAYIPVSRHSTTLQRPLPTEVFTAGSAHVESVSGGGHRTSTPQIFYDPEEIETFPHDNGYVSSFDFVSYYNTNPAN
ncbi:uncharacterized protein JCM6883_000838 [Sporobolomyces salmoneus]|uniref:uncharacterized protein n=1 Tax=Sporobolomyces salmoneus TaxID=183962 RepID=UPI003172DA10